MEPSLKYANSEKNVVILKVGLSEEIVDEIKVIKPKKLIFNEGSWEDVSFLNDIKDSLTYLEINDPSFNWSISERGVRSCIPTFSSLNFLNG